MKDVLGNRIRIKDLAEMAREINRKEREAKKHSFQFIS